MSKNKKYIKLLILACAICVANPSYAQKAKAKKAVLQEIKTTIVDENKAPIVNAELTASEGAIIDYSDKDGNVAIKVKSTGVVLVEALGYEDVVIDLSKDKMPETLVMKKTGLFASTKYNLNRPDGGKTNQQDLVGAISSVTGDELSTFADYSLSNALQGRIAGLTAQKTVNGLGNNVANLYVRGQHGMDGNTAIVIVDGMERSMNDVIAEEVETVEVLKDATAKILYGPRAANGVIVVTTKRGEANKRVLRTTVEAGVMQTGRMPEYLDSYQYATLYNEARANDGLLPFYSDAQLEGYKNTTGVNDALYPNVDYYDYFLNNQATFKKAVLDLNGGDKNIRYALVGSYIGGNGFEAVGTNPNLNRINVRGNLDVKVNDYITFVADAAARLETRDWSSVDGSSTFSRISSVRPNEYPLTISPDELGIPANENGVPHFGASLRTPANLYADMAYGGFTHERYVTSQTNIGLEFDLNKVVEGLTAGGYLNLDNYSYFKEGQTNVYPTYAIRGYEFDAPVYQQMKLLEEGDDKERLSKETRRTFGWRAFVGFERTYDMHDIGATFAANYYTDEATGTTQNVINQHNTLRLNYGFDNRYLVEANAALMGSNRFVGDNRYFLSSALGLGWVLSNEDFLKSSTNINFLKLKASVGRIGYDRNTDYLLYATAWANGSAMSFGEQNNTSAKETNLVRIGSDLEWEYADELNIGIEGFFFNNRLRTEVNYFNEMRNNIIGGKGASEQDILGGYTTLANVGKVHNHGVDAYVSYEERKGDFNYKVGANMVWSKNKIVAANEVDFPDENRKTIGTSTDAMFGYEALGLYGKDVELTNQVQNLGKYGVGDIAYADINNDGTIDGNDVVELGNSFPRISLGVDVTLNYKGWGFYILATSELGVDNWLNNSYYWDNRGEGKYSVVALDRYHPTNNPEGWYPSLTTTQGNNNYVNSSYWIDNTSFMRLKNIELSYTFDIRNPNISLKKVKLFARGTDLFVLSGYTDFDPEVLNAGLNNYPVYTTITGGVSVTF